MKKKQLLEKTIVSERKTRNGIICGCIMRKYIESFVGKMESKTTLANYFTHFQAGSGLNGIR